jgi:hypothetical protein
MLKGIVIFYEWLDDSYEFAVLKKGLLYSFILIYSDD